MKLVFFGEQLELGKRLKELDEAATRAAIGALRDVARLAVTEGRAEIASAGFSSRWQQGLRSTVTQETGEPTARIFHRIGFFSVFETGVTIRGNPLLFLPLEDNLPAGMTRPRQYQGRLVSVNVVGKAPMLFDAEERDRPLFVGVREVTIRPRLRLYALFERVSQKFEDFFRKRLEEEQR